jgi:hypothetical protein
MVARKTAIIARPNVNQIRSERWMCTRYHRSRNKKNIKNQPTVNSPPIVITKPSVARNGSSCWEAGSFISCFLSSLANVGDRDRQPE